MATVRSKRGAAICMVAVVTHTFGIVLTVCMNTFIYLSLLPLLLFWRLFYDFLKIFLLWNSLLLSFVKIFSRNVWIFALLSSLPMFSIILFFIICYANFHLLFWAIILHACRWLRILSSIITNHLLNVAFYNWPSQKSVGSSHIDYSLDFPTIDSFARYLVMHES